MTQWRRTKSRDGRGGKRPGAGRHGLFAAGTTWLRIPLPSPVATRLGTDPAAIRTELLRALREARPEWPWE